MGMNPVQGAQCIPKPAAGSIGLPPDATATAAACAPLLPPTACGPSPPPLQFGKYLVEKQRPEWSEKYVGESSAARPPPAQLPH